MKNEICLICFDDKRSGFSMQCFSWFASTTRWHNSKGYLNEVFMV